MTAELKKWVKCAAESELKAQKSIARIIDGQEIAIFAVGERVVAIQRHCPHEGAKLDEGQIFADKVIKCPLHGFVFDLATGKGLNCPTLHVTTYVTKTENGEIFIEMS